MNMVTLAMRAHKKSDAAGRKYAERGVEDTQDNNAYAKMYEATFELQLREVIQVAKAYKRIQDVFKEVMGVTTENWYFITVRPKPEVEFIDFYKQVCKYVERRMMIEYKLTFEQKDPEGSGEGFHIHIVANTTHRSKGECLRDTQSTFKDIAADNCIKVLTTRTPDKIVENYMIEYKSDDNHKITTKEGDEIWRKRIGLQSLYSSMSPPPTVLSSTVRTVQVVTPVITEIHMNAEDTQTFTNASPIVKRLPLRRKSLK